jgi:hypothetical protein
MRQGLVAILKTELLLAMHPGWSRFCKAKSLLAMHPGWSQFFSRPYKQAVGVAPRW